MKIELKNIHVSEHLSDETNAFTAGVYIDGIHAGDASNHGTGGPTDYYPFNENGKRLIRQAEDYCKKLPSDSFHYAGNEYTIDMSLEHFIDRLLEQHLQQKNLLQFRKKLENAMTQHIVFGTPDEYFSKYKLMMPVENLLQHERGRELLKSILSRQILPQMGTDDKILNTNIPEHIFRESGLNEKQYTAVVTSGKQTRSHRINRSKGI